MIESVERTVYQLEEARTPGSLARNMLALLVRHERQNFRHLQSLLRDRGGEHFETFVDSARTKWLEAHRCAEIVRRVLYGWEQ